MLLGVLIALGPMAVFKLYLEIFGYGGNPVGLGLMMLAGWFIGPVFIIAGFVRWLLPPV